MKSKLKEIYKSRREVNEDQIRRPLPIDELEEDLCEHCICTDYGTESIPYPSAVSIGCEGSHCEEAYENYKDDFYDSLEEG